MSFGKKKMHQICDQLAGQTLVCDHRGMEFMIISLQFCEPGTIRMDSNGIAKDVYEFRYGKVNVEEVEVERFFEVNIDNVDERYKPWAKKLLKGVRQNEEESLAG